jgi:general stress protein YciG
MRQERAVARLRGFASMNVDKQREIAKKGGANVPHEKRSFAQNRALAADAGRKGGLAVAAQSRSFSANRDLACQAGRKGGQATQDKRRRRLMNAEGHGPV